MTPRSPILTLRIRVGCDREFKGCGEVPAEVAHTPVAAAKLRVQGRPTDLDVLAKSMKAVGEPDIDVDYH